MTTPRQTLELLLERRNLNEAQAAALLGDLTNADLAPALAGALLAALRAKGVTADEVRGFAAAMRSLARKPQLPAAPDGRGIDAIDIVGTGGDVSGSLNLSTGAAMLAAACGLPVAKHGNRSISSRSGSADLMEALGLPMPLDEQRAGECFAATGFTFFLAPYYHPAMQAVAPVRAALGVRTVFNMLGPLTNPAAPRFLLVGAYDAAAAELMAGTLAGTQIEHAWVVHGAAGWDEATPIGPFLAFDVRGTTIQRMQIDPRDFGIARCSTEQLAGGDAATNLAALLDVFERRDRGPHLDALLLQCGMALMIAGRAASIEAGMTKGREAIDSGQAQDWLQRLRQFARGTPS
jgi:anthranilate phosphoribosyltransferase